MPGKLPGVGEEKLGVGSCVVRFAFLHSQVQEDWKGGMHLRLCLFWEGANASCGEDVGGGGARVRVSLESGQMVQTGCLWQSRSQIWAVSLQWYN